MPPRYIPEYVQALEPYMEMLKNAPKYPIGDTVNRRVSVKGLFDIVMPTWPNVTDVKCQEFGIPAADGYQIPAYHFSKNGSDIPTPGPCILYIHGGGYIALGIAQYRKILELYVSRSGVPIVAIDYRLAPEFPHPTPTQDCFTALRYMHAHASRLGVDPGRMAVMGDSAGGGAAAGVAIMARDQGVQPPLAKQMLIGNMLDDRTTGVRHQHLEGLMTWTDDDNVTGWSAYLGASAEEVTGGKLAGVSPNAAPARVESVKGLAPLYLECPDLDLFLQENIAYAQRFTEAGIDTEVHVWRGLPHSFEVFAPNIETSQLALNCRVKAMRSLLETQ